MGSLRLLLDAPDRPPVRLLAAPGGLDAAVRGTVIHDPAEPPGAANPDAAPALLLLVGCEVEDPRTRAVARRAAAQGFAALVVKCRGQDPARLVEEAGRCGIAVLAADDATPWRLVDASLSCALAAHGIGDLPASAPAGGEELFALADTLASVVGGSVAVEELDQHVVAYSNVPGQRIDQLREQGILQRRVPAMPEQRRQYREVLAAPGVVRFPRAGAELARAAVAVRAGAVPLGTLWAIEPEGGLTAEAEAALLDGARLAAPHLLRALHSTETEQRVRRETLRALLDGYGPPADEAQARLGLRPGADFCLVAYQPAADAGPAGAGAGALVAHVGSALVRYCAAHRPEATVATTTRAVHVLVPGDGAAARRFAQDALAAVRTAMGVPPGPQGAGGVGVRAAVTRPQRDLLRPAALRREAEDVLRAAARGGPGEGATAADDVRHLILLDRLGDALERDPWLRLPAVTALLASDADQGTQYAATVTAWLESVGDVARAAAGLRVHPNTLRYRLRRVRELFGLDLDDPVLLPAVWLQLRGAVGE